jgi:hypothetical protein
MEVSHGIGVGRFRQSIEDLFAGGLRRETRWSKQCQEEDESPVAADVSPRQSHEFAPTHVGGYRVPQMSSETRNLKQTQTF